MRDRVTALVCSGRVWQYLHGAGTLVWLGLTVPAVTVWRDSITFVVFMSLYAIVLSHTVGYVAAVGARKADHNDPLGRRKR